MNVNLNLQHLTFAYSCTIVSVYPENNIAFLARLNLLLFPKDDRKYYTTDRHSQCTQHQSHSL